MNRSIHAVCKHAVRKHAVCTHAVRQHATAQQAAPQHVCTVAVRHRAAGLVLAFAGLVLPGLALADTLLIDRVQTEAATALPTRGMSMSQVEARFGAPASKLEPRGGQKRQWPTINRWQYPAFVVYFEKSRVIDAVAVKATDGETGPKAPIR